MHALHLIETENMISDYTESCKNLQLKALELLLLCKKGYDLIIDARHE